MYDHIVSRLPTGGPVILDGGVGTDIERRGVPMSGESWCADANLSHPDAVRAVHEDDLRAGAEVLTANTYASSPLSFTAHGREDDIWDIDREAVRLVREAIDRVATRPVAVAGSISVMPAIEAGTEHGDRPEFDEATIRALYQRKAANLAEAGVDLLLMEMMRDTDVSRWATEAALETGLPVWVGMSVERENGELVSHGNHEHPLASMAQVLLRDTPEAALIMHNDLSTTDEALAILRETWHGPLGAYPESGYFAMPHYVVKELSEENFVAACRRWHDAGATILGGCCGIGPEHIAALSAALGKRRS